MKNSCGIEALEFILNYPSDDSHKEFLLNTYPDVIDEINQISDDLFKLNVKLICKVFSSNDKNLIKVFLLRIILISPDFFF